MSKVYYRPLDIVAGQTAARTLDEGTALPLAGGPLAFKNVEILSRNGRSDIVPANELQAELGPVTGARKAVASLSFEKPLIMGVLNLTPDSFSDGGDLASDQSVTARASRMALEGADIWDVGGESTRPGSDVVEAPEECARVLPAIKDLVRHGALPVSIDSRKPEVFEAAIEAGAALINDVSALTYSDGSVERAARKGAPVILMHAQGDPKTMQDEPTYDNVVLDVYDWLEGRIEACVAGGIDLSDIVIDPGIGFGKTLDHNLELLASLSLFHGLGVPVLLGASRKSFIAKVVLSPEPKDRLGGSLAAVLSGHAQGVQIFRVHDVRQTVQALSISAAISRFS